MQQSGMFVLVESFLGAGALGFVDRDSASDCS
jgi:hypothetical protein